MIYAMILILFFFFFFFFTFSVGDTPRATSGVYISHLIRFARVSSRVADSK